VRDTNGTEERVKPLIFATSIGLHSNNLTVKHAFHKALKFFEEFKHLRLMTNKINPSETTQIIDKADIILFMAK
jgi:hypothetical protein